MKKFFVFFVLVSFSFTQLQAQESTFDKGDKVVNLGLGLGSALYSGIGYTGLIPPLSASMELGVVDNIGEKGVIGVGGYLGFSSYKWSNYYRYTSIIIGPRGSFHYPLVDKLDTYAGLMLGYNIRSSTWIGTGLENLNPTSGGIVYSLYIGGRYYFSDNFAAMLELGSGISYLNLGVALKF